MVALRPPLAPCACAGAFLVSRAGDRRSPCAPPAVARLAAALQEKKPADGSAADAADAPAADAPAADTPADTTDTAAADASSAAE